MERATEFKSAPDTGWALLIDSRDRRSAVGCILGDEVKDFNPNIGLPMRSEEKRDRKILDAFERQGVDWNRDRSMIYSLESMHNSLRAEMWDTRMRQIAKDEGLLYEY